MIDARFPCSTARRGVVSQLESVRRWRARRWLGASARSGVGKHRLIRRAHPHRPVPALAAAGRDASTLIPGETPRERRPVLGVKSTRAHPRGQLLATVARSRGLMWNSLVRSGCDAAFAARSHADPTGRRGCAIGRIERAKASARWAERTVGNGASSSLVSILPPASAEKS